MAHSYTNILIHYVFSTKNREKTITVELQEQLWPYIGGIARENNMKALAIGGIEDHVHLLISLPATLSIANAGRNFVAARTCILSHSIDQRRFIKMDT